MYLAKRTSLLHASLALIACVTLAVPVPAKAQAEAKRPTVPVDSPRPKELVVSASAAPVPALKYRLLPISTELIPGDAAPIYLRIHGYEDTSLQDPWRQIGAKSAQWLTVPLKDLPLAEARSFVGIWSGKLKQLEFATRRKSCDWNYTLPEERLNAIEILLPDAQSMREWGRVLAIKARVEAASGKLDEAIRTIGTGLAFARHVGGGPFAINGLVGIALANLVLEPCDDLISQPGAPNLYWALTALERPLISLRDQLEVEQSVCENLIPELTETELSKPRSPADWGSLLSRMHERIASWSQRLTKETPNPAPELKTLAGWNLEKLKAEVLPAAKAYLKASAAGIGPEAAAMGDDQRVALYLVGRYREVRDDLFKGSYLPVPEALEEQSAAEKRLDAAKTPALAFFIAIMGANGPITSLRPLSSQLSLDRRVALLRVIEALRLYAAAHGGSLPETLAEVREVSVPDDPATGKPFVYRRAGAAAILHGPQAGLRAPFTPYRIAIRAEH